MIGTTLSHFRITAKLGEGGMGEVYLAEDTKLGREVAIKVLNEAFTSDPERLARFGREARALAALNHPNIAGIHEVGESGGVHFLVMELAPGETLAERIARGPIRVGGAIPMALRIAEALEAAHENGIIHRDLKPANIKVDDEDKVKVLDFGLAKAFETTRSAADPTTSPTVTSDGTVAGVILGTAAYMSPEQARGRPVDKRSDIWSFGCVLYEMLVGRKPFGGADVSEILAQIITQEPDMDRLPDDLPVQVGDVIRRCLRKDVRMRLRDIGAARIALWEVVESPGSAGIEAGPIRRPQSRLPLVLTATASIVLGLALAWALLGRPAPTATGRGPATHFELVPDPPPAHWAMALSYDSGMLIYSGGSKGERQLYVRELGGFSSRSIPGTEGGYWPFFSPDEQEIGFFSAGRLKTVNLRGGSPEPVCGVSGSIHSAVWTPDDQIIYSSYSTSVPHRVNARGGEPEAIHVDGLEEGARIFKPRLLPGGRAILATLQTPSLDGLQIVVVDLEDGSLKKIARGYDAKYVKPATLLYVQGERVMTARFDPQTRELSGSAREFNLEDPALFREDLVTSFYAAAANNGTLLYPAGSFSQSGELHWLSRDGKTEPIGFSGWDPRLDSTGRHAVVDWNENIWLLDLEEMERTQLTFSDTAFYPVWSRDDQQVIFTDNISGDSGLYAVTPGGAGEIRLVASQARGATSIHPDGRIMYYMVHPETNRDIWILGKDGKPDPVLQTMANERGGAISPDGELFAYVSDEQGSDQVFIRQLPDSDRRWPVSRQGGSSPVWNREGSELFFLSRDTVMAAKVSHDASLRIGEPVAVFTSDRLYVDTWGNSSFDSAPDGKLLITLRAPAEVRIRIVLNWDPEAGIGLTN